MSIVNVSTDPGINIPKEMGVAKSHQMQGTWRENLVELSGRVCYDSLGKGRDSEAWHSHLHEVEHYSVHEHATLTVSIHDRNLPIFKMLFNRPGVWMREDLYGNYRITFNPRCINDWHKHGYPGVDPVISLQLWETLAWHLQGVAPMLVSPKLGCHPARILPSELEQPDGEDEVHVTAFLKGSRGFSHEQVRHRYRTAISQRSTRYVDESKSKWDWHPLINQYMEELGGPNGSEDSHNLMNMCMETQAQCEKTYREIVKLLEPWLKNKTGCDTQTARKQSRGAARGFLGNALNTEMLFTAPVSQWRWMYSMRWSAHADAEIRLIFADLIHHFWDNELLMDLESTTAPDGLGSCLQQ